MSNNPSELVGGGRTAGAGVMRGAPRPSQAKPGADDESRRQTEAGQATGGTWDQPKLPQQVRGAWAERALGGRLGACMGDAVPWHVLRPSLFKNAPPAGCALPTTPATLQSNAAAGYYEGAAVGAGTPSGPGAMAE